MGIEIDADGGWNRWLKKTMKTTMYDADADSDSAKGQIDMLCLTLYEVKLHASCRPEKHRVRLISLLPETWNP